MAKKKKRKPSDARGTHRWCENQSVSGLLKENRPDEIELVDLYDLWFTFINSKTKITTETRQQADAIFTKIIMQAASFKTHLIKDKKKHWQKIFHAAKQAIHHDGTIAVVRNVNNPYFSGTQVQVIDCAIEQGLFWEHRSKKGSPKMTRIVPIGDIREYSKMDPWTFDPETIKKYVILSERNEDQTPIPFNLDGLPPGHIANMAQERLELINKVNSLYTITHRKWLKTDRIILRKRYQLRPVHYARFTERWDWHGRIYTGKYGHQNLRKIERQTIKFSDNKSVEKDYGSFHTRMLFHLRSLKCEKDPYLLWGKKTTPEHRKLAKKLINTAINAESKRSAVSACNNAMNTCDDVIDKKTGKRKRVRKTGKVLEDALDLYDAYKKVGMKFDEIYDLAVERLKPIAHHFGSDAGMWLMSIDSQIAIDIMYELAKQMIPCLCCHDSFIVPREHSQLLSELMNKWYFLRFNNYPVIKTVGENE